ncbi:protein kinase domain-containing protein [Haloarcula pellucida]|uniref:Protein kinase domain-containing protein n=1 Tax=Haloarcula pellucida TaxID=1427151 RepID=A0A830GHG6_9EURY|nr:hypothetical protein [Halomicroarcula pellucida]MBX0347128.1 hypothetical protein [Halomicroarcula pellucida]GGN87118.1 hypothetical protein GCM10009030_05490 [Halomicroarcula pellucida]
MTPESGGGAAPSAVVADVLTGANVDRDRLPTLLALLEVGDRQVRLGAATALCVLAEEHPNTVAYLTGRLLDRIQSDDDLPAALALDYLAARHPETVERELDALLGADESSYDVEQPTPMRGSLGNRDIGRTTLAGAGVAPGPRRVYTDEADADGDTEEEAEDVPDELADETGRTIPQRPRANDAEWLSLVEYESRFETLTVLAPRDRRRYSDTYRTLGVVDDEEYAVALRILRGGDTRDTGYRSGLRNRLSDWASVGDEANVVTLYDWHEDPRFWIASEYTDQRLADRDRLPPAEAAWHAERLASALATLHERGIVHAGIDPTAVAYYGNVLREGDRQPPLLDNVGLLSVYRQHADPSQFLDPRYAAPEYYERRFGRIDHATDIYQLGAVCYRLFTGQPPYRGEFDVVREQVLRGPPPVPTDVADVPAELDAVVGKAMATKKLTRYETATHLAQELRALRDPQEDDGG